MVKLIDWQSYDPTILDLHSQGKSPNFISKQIGLQRETIVKRMEGHLGIQTKRNGPRNSADWVDSENIRCSICSEVKHMTEYYKIRKDSVICYSFCKSCNSDKERVRYLASPVNWRKKTYDLKNSSGRRGIDFDLTEAYLMYIYGLQEGLCAYTGVKLDLSTGRGLADNCVSVDRFDTNLGYFVGNVVMCSSRSNTIKHNQSIDEFATWMPVWYQSGLSTLAKINAGWPSDNYSTEVADVA